MNTNIKHREAGPGIKPVGAQGFCASLTQLLRRYGASQRTTGQRELGQLRAALVDCAASVGREVSARKQTASITEAYREFDDCKKLAVFNLLISEFGPSESAVTTAIHDYLVATSTDKRKAEAALRMTLLPHRSRMLMQFNSTVDGVKSLIDMRADILRLLPLHPELQILDQELHDLLAIWFDHGFLELRRITWSSPASLLEKLIAYEAVHEIRSWSDLRNRLDSDRRCYALFHPRIPDEPLVFVEVALAKGFDINIQDLLDESVPVLDLKQASAAIFYSISNTQSGLRGISLGNTLIKRVAELLLQELPQLKVFTTLSPLPRFRTWLDTYGQRSETLMTPSQCDAIRRQSKCENAATGLSVLLASKNWHLDERTSRTLEPILLRLAVHYLVSAKTNGRPYDPVARFHLGNGARIERLKWLADTSARGMTQSAGIMVNYRYKLDDLEKNHEAYSRDGKVIACSTVRRLASSASLIPHAAE